MNSQCFRFLKSGAVYKSTRFFNKGDPLLRVLTELRKWKKRKLLNGLNGSTLLQLLLHLRVLTTAAISEL